MTASFGLLTLPMPGAGGLMAKSVEDAGWDELYYADTQNLAAEVYVSLGLAAAATSRIRLATGVTNPVTRHPAVTASAIASIHVASGGRAVLGIGRGDSSLGVLGKPPASPGVFEEYLTRVRAYLHDRPADLDDGSSRNEWIGSAGLAPVPIDVAATGPKVTGIAARLADRVTFAVGADEQRLRDAIAMVRAERAAAGLDPASISVGAYVNVVAHPDVAMARSLVRGSAASFAHFSGMAGAPTVAEPEMAATFAKLGQTYDMANHARAHSAQGEAMSDEFLDRFAIAGPVDECVERLGALIELGLERVVMIPGSRDADVGELMGSVERIAGEVLPRLR